MSRIDELEAALRGGPDVPSVTPEELLALVEVYRAAKATMESRSGDPTLTGVLALINAIENVEGIR